MREEEQRPEFRRHLVVHILDIYKADDRGTDIGIHEACVRSLISLIYYAEGRWTETEQLQAQVMEIRKMELGANHPITLRCMANLATTYRDQGRRKEAEQLQVQVMGIRKTELGADHPDTLPGMVNPAYTWKSQGRIADAMELMEQSVQAHIRVLGAEHRHTIRSLSALRDWREETEKPHQS